MKAPDTIYFSQRYSCMRYERTYDTDLAYVRADLPYELAKTVEAQKAEIEDLRDLLASTSLEAGKEIARLREALIEHGNHKRNCQENDEGDDCTCGFTAALRSE